MTPKDAICAFKSDICFFRSSSEVEAENAEAEELEEAAAAGLAAPALFLRLYPRPPADGAGEEGVKERGAEDEEAAVRVANCGFSLAGVMRPLEGVVGIVPKRPAPCKLPKNEYTSSIAFLPSSSMTFNTEPVTNRRDRRWNEIYRGGSKKKEE